MKNELKFNSAVCTSAEQSQRLLDLGLKPETADMYYSEGSMDAEGDIEYHLNLKRYWVVSLPPNHIPAWSLHRLMIILNPVIAEFSISTLEDAYEDIIYNISESIKNGYFNKEYLKQ